MGAVERVNGAAHLLWQDVGMAIWNTLRTELDRAGRAAQGALDEGKLRLEIFRVRQLVDRAAQSLGYAVFRSRTGRDTLDEAALARLTTAVQERENELIALEERMRGLSGRASAPSDTPPAAASSTSPMPGRDASSD